MTVFKVESNSEFPNFMFVEVVDPKHNIEVRIEHTREGVRATMVDEFGREWDEALLHYAEANSEE